MNAESKNNQIIISAILALMLAGAVIYLIVEIKHNSRLSENLLKEKVLSEVMLSEKLSAEKETVKTRAELDRVKHRETAANNTLQTTLAELTETKRLLARSGSDNRTTALLKSRNKELSIANEKLQKELAGSELSEQKLQATNDDLALALAVSQGETGDLKDKLNTLNAEGRAMKLALVESTTKSGKLTTKAKRTKKISVHVEVPADAGDINVGIFNPEGKELQSSDGTTSVYASPVNTILASGKQTSTKSNNRVQMTFIPKHKLTPGLYTIEINGSKPVGSLQVRLR